MSLETIQSPLRQPVRAAATATPPRLKSKGPVGADFLRQSPAEAGRPRQSAVERLEADKAKYVKSRIALSKQQPIRPPEMRKALLLSPRTALRPTKKVPSNPTALQGSVPLNMEDLSKLINGMNEGPVSCGNVGQEHRLPRDHTVTTHHSPSRFPPTPPDGAQQAGQRPSPPPCPAEAPGCVACPSAVTVRRVDVIPQAGPMRAPSRPQQYIRQALQPTPLYTSTSKLRRFHLRATPGPSPLKPVVAQCKPDQPPVSPATPLDPPTLPVLPPASPAITRLSSSSSRKRPSLTRSKSDMSDRYSRAGTELERFFNLCGLDASEVQDLTGPGSDIVSLLRFPSASAPGSECVASDRGDEDGDEDDVEGNSEKRLPYGVSVIERNARVIKWLYGLGQAKDNAKSTNM